MAKEGYGFSCWKCARYFDYPLTLSEALSYKRCPHCGGTAEGDMVFWKCNRCGAHNDHDWEKCQMCDSPK